MSRYLARFKQQPQENLRYSIDYSYWLDAGEKCSYGTVESHVLDGASTNLTLSPVNIGTGGTSVYFFVGGGDDGGHYKVTLRVTTDKGQTVEHDIKFSIKEV